MPFSRYLQSNERDGHDDDFDHHAFSSAVHFQLPNLIFNAPSVPPGGGAEALPAGLYPPPASLSWFSSSDSYNNPFPPPSVYHPPSAPSTSSSPQSASDPAFSLPPLPPPYASHPPDPAAPPISFPPQLPLSIPSALGLPIYSASGFDLLSLLSRVLSRPYPKIYLGPVDLSCSFVVTDTRRFDSPIVYASPSFLRLTGYDEHEVIGRNCRFLQSPAPHLHPGQDRTHTSRDAVAHMRKNISADKECQVSIINYRKDGSAFINMVSVIPLRGGVHNSPQEADDVVYHIGFQVDLTEQPKSILSKLKDGTYVVNYSDKPVNPPPASSRDWRTSSISIRALSKDLRALLANPAFTASFHLPTSTHVSTALALSNNPSEPITLDPYDGNKPLHMFLLDRSPDFFHVVSLKGDFLYVAPAVRHVLGYDPDELVGRSLTHFCHPADCVPLMRELKEASSTPAPSLLGTTASPSATNAAITDSPLQGAPNASPRPVDLLFRIQAKGRGHVWIECRGRLHAEPGKSRKAIILSGRVRNMPHLEWGPIARAGGLVSSLPSSPSTALAVADDDGGGVEDRDERCSEREFWGLLSTNATFLYVGAAVRDVLGWGAGEVIGSPLADFVGGTSPQEIHVAIEVEMTKVLADAGGAESAGLVCEVRTKGGGTVPVHVVMYRSRPAQHATLGSSSAAAAAAAALRNGGDPAVEPPIVCQVKRCDGGVLPPTNKIVHALGKRVFEETELERNSSWQYELQQLKFRNQRLADEIAALEAGITKKVRRKQTSTTSLATPSSTARRMSAGSRRNIMYSQLPGVRVPPPPPSSTPLNVRFVSSSHDIPRGAPSESPDAYQGPPPPVSQPTHSSMLPRTSQMSHQQLQQPPPMPPPGPLPQYEQPGSDAAIFLQPRVRQSNDSSLQGWSSYQFDAVGAERATGVGGNTPPTSFSAVPMKRSWHNSLRDPGGGGA